MSSLPKLLPIDDRLSCDHRSLRMFCNLSREVLADYDAIGSMVRLPKGAILFREDDLGDRVSVIRSGQVKLSCGTAEGKTLILRIASAGDVLGLSAVISGCRYEVTARTLESCYAKVIRRDEFLAFLNRHVEASMLAAKALSEEYRSAFFDVRRLALSGSVAGRLANVLLDMGRSASHGKPEMCFKMTLTHDDLASFTGTTRETVTRALGKFQRENLIAIRGASFHILLPERLAELSA